MLSLVKGETLGVEGWQNGFWSEQENWCGVATKEGLKDEQIKLLKQNCGDLVMDNDISYYGKP